MICVDQNVTGQIMEKYERLRKAREDAGFTSAAKAAEALGLAASTYRAHENGQNDFDFIEAQRYAKKFNVDSLWLFAGKAQSPELLDAQAHFRANRREPIVEMPASNAVIGDRVTASGLRIPVYGQAVGGEDGQFEMNGNMLFDVLAPPSLTPASGAYAICVSGSSMSPRYEDGEICFIDPKRRVRPGDYVVAQIKQNDHDAPLAFIKRLVRWTTNELILEQFNPPKNIQFPGGQVHSVHFVAMAGIA